MSSLERCANCAYWSQQDSGYGHQALAVSLGLGICTLADTFWDSTTWNGAGDKVIFAPEAEHVHHFVQDGSDYNAYLITRPTYGCVSFQSAPTIVGRRLSYLDRLKKSHQIDSLGCKFHAFKSALGSKLGGSINDSNVYPKVAAYLDAQGIPYATDPPNVEDGL